MSSPLFFGEIGVKTRIKAIAKYKKTTWGIAIIFVILLLILGVLFLTNPKTNISSGAVQNGLGVEKVSDNQNIHSYNDIISKLTGESKYAYVDLGMQNQVLVVTDMTYEIDGSNAALDCNLYYEMDNEVYLLGSVQSMGTAYPVSIKDNYVITASNQEMGIYKIDTSHLTLSESRYKAIYGEENDKYIYIDYSGEEKEITEEEYLKAFNQYSDAKVISFE